METVFVSERARFKWLKRPLLLYLAQHLLGFHFSGRPSPLAGRKVAASSDLGPVPVTTNSKRAEEEKVSLQNKNTFGRRLFPEAVQRPNSVCTHPQTHDGLRAENDR